MQYTKLGNSDLKVSRICMGCMGFGDAAIGSESISLDGYSTIYIGYPIWWGEEPRIMDTFVESYNFDGVTMIPFCTSSSSGIGMSGKNLADNAQSGQWLDGNRFGAGASEEEIASWINGLQ